MLRLLAQIERRRKQTRPFTFKEIPLRNHLRCMLAVLSTQMILNAFLDQNGS